MSIKSRFDAILAYIGDNEGLAITVMASVVTAALVGLVMVMALAFFTVNQIQCRRMCSVSGDEGLQADHGCVCAHPEGERWTYPVAVPHSGHE